MKRYEALSFCGIYCGGCRNYKANMNCMGCRYEEALLDDCPTRTCAIGRGLLHCGECEGFPCGELLGFYDDGRPSHRAAYQNMLEIKRIGLEKWLAEQEAERNTRESSSS